MPKKQNGWGKAESFTFKKVDNRTDVGKRQRGGGHYPSDRRFGAAVTRTVIEKFDLDSDWVKWRKGFEYYNKAAWYRLQTYDPLKKIYEETKIQSKLYQGTPYEVDVEFDGYKFATANADSNNHYVMKRTTTSKPDIGVVVEVWNDEFQYPEQKKYKEIWCKGILGAQGELLFNMIGERVTDGVTEATIKNLLTSDAKPALYKGKSDPENLTQVKVKAPLASFDKVDVNDLPGKIVFIKDFYINKPLSDVDEITFSDERDYFYVDIKDSYNCSEIEILDPEQDQLPPTLYDIATLDPIYQNFCVQWELTGRYVYKKDQYQRFFGSQYLTGDVVESEVTDCSYAAMPYKILSVNVTGTDVEILSEPFSSDFQMNVAPDGQGFIVFSDHSFTRTGIDEYDGVYYHTEGDPNKPEDWQWLRIDTDIDPWMDEIFAPQYGRRIPLTPATIYTCSCPNYAHAILRAPQETEDSSERLINRQRRYPLPTAQGKATYDALGINSVSGRMESWETEEHRMSFKQCKHTIAARFIERIKTREPKSVPSSESRERFEEKLAKDMSEVGTEFVSSYRRGGLTALEVVFALAQGLNLDDVETAFVVLGSKF